MSFCGKCGTQVADGVKFCPGCGTPIQAAPPETQQQASYQQPPVQPPYQQQAPQTQVNMPQFVKDLNNTADHTAEMDPNDIQQNKVLALFSYLGLLFLIPWFAAPQSRYARFHAQQGIVLCIADVAYGIVSALLSLIKVPVRGSLFGVSYMAGYQTPWFISLIVFLLGIPFLVLTILGIVNACTGKAKELPILGKIKLFK